MRGKAILHCILYHAGLHAAETQTTVRERAVLSAYARGRQRLLEIGMFEGVTARVLRDAMSPEGVLWCIDPFWAGKLGISYGLLIARRELARSRNGSARIVRKLSHDAAVEWREPLDFIFIDADHSYDAVRQDWTDWREHLRVGGVVLFHDSNVAPGGHVRPEDGPCRVVQEILRGEAAFRCVETCDSLTVFERVH